MKSKQMRVMPYKNQFHSAITYELSSTNIKYYRQVYSFLDWLGNIGGLYGAVSTIFGSIVFIFQFSGTNMFLMTEMFSSNASTTKEMPYDSSLKQKDARRPKKLRDQNFRNNVQWNCCRVLVSNIQRMCPRKCLCCCLRMKHRDWIFTEGYRSLEKEIHVTYFLKQIRVLKGIIKEQMTRAQWQNAFVKYSLKSVDKVIERKLTEEDLISTLRIVKTRSTEFFPRYPNSCSDIDASPIVNDKPVSYLQTDILKNSKAFALNVSQDSKASTHKKLDEQNPAKNKSPMFASSIKESILSRKVQ